MAEAAGYIVCLRDSGVRGPVNKFAVEGGAQRKGKPGCVAFILCGVNLLQIRLIKMECL